MLQFPYIFSSLSTWFFLIFIQIGIGLTRYFFGKFKFDDTTKIYFLKCCSHFLIINFNNLDKKRTFSTKILNVKLL
jgi:hypothetical protein